jgi:hypothetical protein
LNRRHTDFQSVALPTELPRHSHLLRCLKLSGIFIPLEAEKIHLDIEGLIMEVLFRPTVHRSNNIFEPFLLIDSLIGNLLQ